MSEVTTRLNICLERLKDRLAKISIGRASPAMVSDIIVDAYDSKMKIVELGNITIPNPSLILIHVYDKSLTHEVVKAIKREYPYLNPTVG